MAAVNEYDIAAATTVIAVVGLVAVLVLAGWGLFRLGRRRGRNETAALAIRDRVEADTHRAMSFGERLNVCGAAWPADADDPHVCRSPQDHPMEHRCACGALDPS